jgi:hypothetical protein
MRTFQQLQGRVPHARLMATLVLAVLAGGCSDSPASPADPRPDAVIIPGSIATVYEGDQGTLHAIVVDQFGNEMPGVPLNWETTDTHLLELQPNGTYLALAEGEPVVRARVTASPSIHDEVAFPIAPLPVLSVTITNGPISVAAGDARVLGVEVTGPAGRRVIGRLVTITSDDPAVAVIDPAGRVRGTGEGFTTVRATADGVQGTAQVTVVGSDVAFDLASWNGRPVPFALDSGWVVWDGVQHFHVVKVDSGSFHLRGANPRRWELRLRIMEYRAEGVGAGRTLTPMLAQNFTDRGVVSYDHRGDLILASEVFGVAPQWGELSNLGAFLQYRIPGGSEVLALAATRRP